MSNYKHVHLAKHFKAMGYHLPGSGVCAGLAQMSIQAFLAGKEEFSRFNQRLELIATSSPEELSSRIRKAREAIAERSRKKRLDAKLGENEMVIVDLSEEEDLLTETEAFFGGVEAYLHSQRHQELFAKLVPQSQVQGVIPFIESTALVVQGGMRVADSFPGIYSLVELQDYFNRLTQILLHYCPPCNIAMGLSCINHRISILFDRARGVWIMHDANQLPAKETSSPAELADALFVALARNIGEGSAATIAAFNTSVYATGKNELHVKKIMTEVKKSAEFNRAHKVTLRKVNERTGILNVSLANIAAKFGHQDVLKAIAGVKSGALNESGHCGATPLHTAAALNLPEMVKMLADQKVSLEAKDKEGRTPLYSAMMEKSVEAMTALLTEEKGLVSTAVDTFGCLPLHWAARNNDVATVKLLIAKGASPLAEIVGGWSPVALAARMGSVEALKALIAIVPKENLETTSAIGTTPLMLAAIGGHAKIVDCFAEEKIDFNTKLRGGDSALHLAVKYNHLAVVEALIRGGAIVDVEDSAGNTPLHLAAKLNKKEIFDLLIKHGANAGKQNIAGQTPLTPGFIAGGLVTAVSARDSMLENIESLKKRFSAVAHYKSALEQLTKDVLKSYQKISLSAVAASPFSVFYSTLSPAVGLAFVAAENDNSAALRLLRNEEKIVFETVNDDFRSPLHVAVMNDSSRIMDVLISDGADLTYEIKSSGTSAVYLAAERGLTAMLRKIVSNVPVRFLNKANLSHETPLYAAVINGHDQAVRVLIEAGADVNQAANSGYAPIHLSIEKNHFKIFKMLVETADLNQEVGRTGVTAVALAAWYGHIEFLRILIEKSPPVDINTKCGKGLTPLMYAVKNRQVREAKMLIEVMDAKALNEKDKSGAAALHMAIENNDIELVQTLLSKGADVNLAREPDGKTPVQLAVWRHQVAIVNLLRKHDVDLRKVDGNDNSALSIGSPLADATTRKKQVYIALDAWIDELQQAQPDRILPAAVDLEFTRLKQLMENDFETNYEAFCIRYDEELFGNNYYLLIAFIAAENGYKNLLELSLEKIDANAKNPAGLTLSQVAEVNHHLELVRILQDYGEGHELKREVGLPLAGLFASRVSESPLLVTPKDSALIDSCYMQLKETILEEAKCIEDELGSGLRFNPSWHRQMLKSTDIKQQLDECDKAASKEGDKYHYLKAQCEDRRSLLHHAIDAQTDMDMELAVSPLKNVLAKIAELDATLAARDFKPES